MPSEATSVSIEDFAFVRATSIWAMSFGSAVIGAYVRHARVVLETYALQNNYRLGVFFGRIRGLRAGYPPGFVDTETFGLAHSTHTGTRRESASVAYTFGCDRMAALREGLFLQAERCHIDEAENTQREIRVFVPGLLGGVGPDSDVQCPSRCLFPLELLDDLCGTCVSASAMNGRDANQPLSDFPAILGASPISLNDVRILKSLTLWSNSDPAHTTGEPAHHAVIVLEDSNRGSIRILFRNVVHLQVRGGHPGVPLERSFRFWRLETGFMEPLHNTASLTRSQHRDTEAGWGFGDYVVNRTGPLFCLGAREARLLTPVPFGKHPGAELRQSGQ